MTVVDKTQRYREFKLPDVGEGLTEAEILKWHVQVGDTVSDGQVVVEIETVKSAVELPIPYTGVVHELLVPEGSTVAVSTAIITVDTDPDGSAPADGPTDLPVSTEPAPPKREPVLVGYGVAHSSTTPRPRRGMPARSTGVKTVATPASSSGRPAAKPPVRKLAKDLGVDLARIQPTGPGGIVTRSDVQAAASAAAPAAMTARVTAAPVSPVAAGAGELRSPIEGVRKAIAEAMVKSAFTAPHVTEFVTVDVTRSMRLLQDLKQDREFAQIKVSPLLLVAKALLVAIRRNPTINATWDEANQQIVQKEAVNLGIAAATPRGLIVPNIKDAGRKSLPELAAALADLVAVAREGATQPAATRGGTVTITNVGVFGVDTGTPILNPGESAILAFGAIKLMPWVHKGRVCPRQVTTLALSFDHRLVDGELGSKVLADTAAVLERPKRLISWT